MTSPRVYTEVGDAIERASAANDAELSPCWCDATTGMLQPLLAERHGRVRRRRYLCKACGLTFRRIEVMAAP